MVSGCSQLDPAQSNHQLGRQCGGPLVGGWKPCVHPGFWVGGSLNRNPNHSGLHQPDLPRSKMAYHTQQSCPLHHKARNSGLLVSLLLTTTDYSVVKIACNALQCRIAQGFRYKLLMSIQLLHIVNQFDNQMLKVRIYSLLDMNFYYVARCAL